MDPRDILLRDSNSFEDEKPLTVFVDTASMNEEISDGNPLAPKVLQYHKCKWLNFVRTPEDTLYPEIDEIKAFEWITDGENRNIKWERRDRVDSLREHEHKIAFRYSDDAIIQIAETILEIEKEGHSEISDYEFKAVRKAFLQATFNRTEESHIFITENNLLLENRIWLENHYPNRQLNIMSLSEGKEYLGLYLRYRDQFPISPTYKVGMLIWYRCLKRTLLPHFHYESDKDLNYMRALGTRFENLLMALDKIGWQYYRKQNNWTDMRIRYHFDYAIILMTGVFDSLALQTQEEYNIIGIDKERVSISNKRGREFLREVREKNSDLRELIGDYMAFINLIQSIRPYIVHRGGYQTTGFTDVQQDWEGNLIPLEFLNEDEFEEFLRYYKQLSDQYKDWDPITEWGMYNPDDSHEYHLEPYQFLKRSIEELARLADSYLEVLGFNNYIEKKREGAIEHGDTAYYCERIRENGLIHFRFR